MRERAQPPGTGSGTPLIERDGDDCRRVDVGDTHSPRSARNRLRAPGRRSTAFRGVLGSARTNQDPLPFEVIESRFDGRGRVPDCANFGHGLPPVGNRDRLPIADLPKDLREPRLGIVCRIVNAHGDDYNQSRRADWSIQVQTTAACTLYAPGAGRPGCDERPRPGHGRSRPGRRRFPGSAGTAPSRLRFHPASSRRGSAPAAA